MAPLNRLELVVELLWYMRQHQCCPQPELYHQLDQEARAAGLDPDEYHPGRSA